MEVPHEMSEEDRKLVDAYQSSVNDEQVDLALLMGLLTKLHASKKEGKFSVITLKRLCQIFILLQVQS
jgi:hypothetical protein